ncbi:MAG: type II toxin-antitoxin system PemK/MazF family toxin [Clostridia bacterium]|nr:type II toxin-antitoxin system PemK/MazF family toxin [Clostridia bacterium]NCC44964.1 type II toxin-antitoxin system PemK/MazF family toxin [Clostridia bacterium]
MKRELLRGDVIYVKLDDHPYSSVQSGMRPCLVISSYPSSKVANVCPFTAKLDKKNIPVHVKVEPQDVNGYLEKPSLLLVEQITTIDRKKIISKTGHIPEDSEVMSLVNKALIRQLMISDEKM